MASPANEGLPELPPIKTTPLGARPAPSVSAARVSAEDTMRAAMASPADEAFPALPPIKTAPLDPAPSASDARVSAENTMAAAAGEQEDEKDQEPSTPTSEDSKLPLSAECQPAPRKPAAAARFLAKRKPRPSSTSRVCLTVPRDLSTVFRSMPVHPEKPIRAL